MNTKLSNSFKKSMPILGLIAGVMFAFTACAPKVYTTGFWYNKERQATPVQKIYIMSLGSQVMSNAIVENDFYTECNRRGISTVKNSLIAPRMLNTQIQTKEEIMKDVNEQGCDAIFTIALLDVKTESRYVPGSVSVGVGGYYNPYAYGYYNNFYGYYNYNYATVSSPGYYVNDKTYYVECNLFDVKDEKLIFSIQSKTTNPTNIEEISKAYVSEVFRKLESEKVVKPMP
jgi:hypothetical protein